MIEAFATAILALDDSVLHAFFTQPAPVYRGA
jgi:hypothetical protein